MAPAEVTAANKPVIQAACFKEFFPMTGPGGLRTKIALIILGKCQGSQGKAGF
jgi:hypothetical protein